MVVFFQDIERNHTFWCSMSASAYAVLYFIIYYQYIDCQNIKPRSKEACGLLQFELINFVWHRNEGIKVSLQLCVFIEYQRGRPTRNRVTGCPWRSESAITPESSKSCWKTDVTEDCSFLFQVEEAQFLCAGVAHGRMTKQVLELPIQISENLTTSTSGLYLPRLLFLRLRELNLYSNSIIFVTG
jgi:hypothetical protein